MKVSVVTVCRNAAPLIEETLRSVIGQTGIDMEYIVVDGASTDSTMQILGRYANRIAQLVSQPDRGPYDAMNHALELCHGEYVLFMNAGDTFVDSDTLSRMCDMVDGRHEVYYGDCIIRRRDNSLQPKARRVRDHWRGSFACHQSVLMRVCEQYRFDLRFSLAADYELLCRIEYDGGSLCHLPLPVCIYRAGGLSDGQPEVIRQWRSIATAYYPDQISLAYYSYLLAVTRMKYAFRKIVGILKH